MREHLLVLLIAAVFVYLLTPYARTLALKSGAVAKVRDRDVHTEVTARWGGIAIWLSIMLTILIASQLNLLSKAFQQDEQINEMMDDDDQDMMLNEEEDDILMQQQDMEDEMAFI